MRPHRQGELKPPDAGRVRNDDAARPRVAGQSGWCNAADVIAAPKCRDRGNAALEQCLRDGRAVAQEYRACG
jgi:hypothetical protein